MAPWSIFRWRVTRLEGAGKIKAERAFKAAKLKVVTILKNLKASGELQLENSEEPLAGSSGDQNSAHADGDVSISPDDQRVA